MISGVPDGSDGPCFSGGPFFQVDPDGQRALDCPHVLFSWVFRTDFVTSVWVSDAFAGILALAGTREPQESAGVSSAPPPPRVRP